MKKIIWYAIVALSLVVEIVSTLGIFGLAFFYVKHIFPELLPQWFVTAAWTCGITWLISAWIVSLEEARWMVTFCRKIVEILFSDNNTVIRVTEIKPRVVSVRQRRRRRTY